MGSQEAGVQRSGLRPTVPGVTCTSPPLQFLSDDKMTGWRPENICATDEAGSLIGLRPAPTAPPRVAGSPVHPGWGDKNHPHTHIHTRDPGCRSHLPPGPARPLPPPTRGGAGLSPHIRRHAVCYPLMKIWVSGATTLPRAPAACGPHQGLPLRQGGLEAAGPAEGSVCSGLAKAFLSRT